MKMNLNGDKVDGLSNALGGRIELLEKLVDKDGLSEGAVQIVADSEFREDFIKLYGFHIDSNESDPSEAVTYLEDAVGMRPAFMDYAADEFNYGDWEDAFFMPRPCMLKYDGTVDYYLDPNDYSKKADGSDSDVSDFEYGGNAMMEWGRDGHQIWYKIVPDKHDNTSASIYFCNYKLDDGFHAWSFINNQGNLVEHFYTPIYNGTIDGDGKLRSISGKENTDLSQNKTATEEITAAELNNPGEDKLWYTETFADITLINLLLVLMGKCLDTQLVFGSGVVYKIAGSSPKATDMIGTGTVDDKGLFYGTNDKVTSVKVFGMENWWGNETRRFAGLIINAYAIKYKMTYGTADGSNADGYNITGENYIDSEIVLEPTQVSGFNGSIKQCVYFEHGCLFPISTSSSTSIDTYFADYIGIPNKNVYPWRGGEFYRERMAGAFYLTGNVHTQKAYANGVSLSCKPLS